MNFIKWPIIIAILFTFTGCSNSGDNLETVEPSFSTFTPGVTVTPGSTNTPTSKTTPPAVYLPFPTPIPDTNIIQRCVPLTGFNFEMVGLEGFLTLSTEPLDPYGDVQRQFLNLTSGKIEAITNSRYPFDLRSYDAPTFVQIQRSDGFRNLSHNNISPNKEMYFSIEELPGMEKDQIWVGRSDGSTLFVAEWEKEWGRFAEWVDNERILFYPPLSEKYLYGTAYLFDLNTQQTIPLVPNFQNNLNIDRLVIAYNPQLTHSFYYGGSYYSLNDLNLQEDIIQPKGLALLSFRPVWNSTGDKVFFGLSLTDPESQELFVASLAGNISQLTTFHDAYPGMTTYINSIRLSPNGNRVAATIAVSSPGQKYQGPIFVILDLESGQMIDTCLIQATEDVYWSPDSTKIALTIPTDVETFMMNRFTGKKKGGNVVILDLNTWEGWQLDQDTSVIGWIK